MLRDGHTHPTGLNRRRPGTPTRPCAEALEDPKGFRALLELDVDEEPPGDITDLDDDSPARQLRLGFDTAGRILEIVVLRLDSGNELVVHPMRARRQYLDLLD